ncbi:MAG: hypothetical protein ACJA07_001535 [Rhodococcus sp. (in: high G+C Gram-positive bacteria)]|jgi:hypothetical protein
MSRGAQKTPGWLLVETLSARGPGLLFESSNTRGFKRLDRRDNFRSTGVSDALYAAVDEVRNTASSIDTRMAVPGVYLQAHPVFGPDRAVYGVQVWVGGAGDEVAPRRTAEAFSFDPETALTHHGPGVDSNILVVDSLAPKRPSHDRIFSYYDNFVDIKALGDYVDGVRDGSVAHDSTFQADISLTDGLGRGRNIHVSMVSVQARSGRAELRGILHDITDIRPHTTNYALALAKRLANESDPNVGRALIDLTTGIALEWLNPPRGRLDPWIHRIPEFTARGRETASNLRQRVVADASLYVQFETQIRFGPGSDEWIDTTIGFEHYGQSQGIMTVRETAIELTQSLVPTTAQGSGNTQCI